MTKTMTRTCLVLAAAWMATAALAEPAAAGDPAQRVRFADLNLELERDRAVLDARLLGAARSLCATAPLARSQWLEEAEAACLEATLADREQWMAAAIRAQRARKLAVAQR